MSKLEVVVLKDRVLIGESVYRVNWVQARPTGSKHYDGREVATFTVNLPTGQPMQETGKIRLGDAPTVDRPKLSDLILAGALLHPQGFGNMWHRNYLHLCAWCSSRSHPIHCACKSGD